jgi:hypothetical protein
VYSGCSSSGARRQAYALEVEADRRHVMNVNQNTVVDYVAVTTPDDDEPHPAKRPETRAYVRLIVLLVVPTLLILLFALLAQTANGA